MFQRTTLIDSHNVIEAILTMVPVWVDVETGLVTKATTGPGTLKYVDSHIVRAWELQANHLYRTVLLFSETGIPDTNKEQLQRLVDCYYELRTRRDLMADVNKISLVFQLNSQGTTNNTKHEKTKQKLIERLDAPYLDVIPGEEPKAVVPLEKEKEQPLDTVFNWVPVRPGKTTISQFGELLKKYTPRLF